jgi:peptide/nickel transport system substrate-binding protein
MVVVGLLASACGSGGTGTASGGAPTTSVASSTLADVVQPSSGQPRRGGSIVYAVNGEADGWNPTTSQWAPQTTTEAQSVLDPLAAWGPNYDAQPYLAKAFTHSADYKTWNIVLRPGVTFSDGEVLDATAVKTDLDAVAASTLTGTALAPVTSTTVIDPLTLAVHMSMPWSVFPTVLTTQAGYIDAPKEIQSGDTKHAVGTGPFVMTTWVPNSSLTVIRNPHYWRKGLPYLDQITFKPMSDPQTMYDSLVSGDTDLIQTSEPQIETKLGAAAARHQIQLVHSSGESEEESVMLNTQVAPMNELVVRQAIAYATDTQQYAKVTGTDPKDLATGPFAAGSKWYVPTGYPSYDLAKAKARVQQYTAEHGAAPSFSLICGDEIGELEMCQLLQHQWAAAGMTVKLVTEDEATQVTAAITGNYQASDWRQFGSQDPDGDSVWWNGANTKPPLALNMARNVDPTIDAALYVGRTSHIKQQRQLAYITLARQLAKDLPYIWLSHTIWMVGAANDIRGFDTTTLPSGEKTDPVISGVVPVDQLWLAN